MLAKLLQIMIGCPTCNSFRPASYAWLPTLAAYHRLGPLVPLETLSWDYGHPSFAYIRYPSSLTGAPLMLGLCTCSFLSATSVTVVPWVWQSCRQIFISLLLSFQHVFVIPTAKDQSVF
jgi:hypothetical protein